MDEWIKELERGAEDSQAVYDRGDLCGNDPITVYCSGQKEISLEGDFTVEQLGVLIQHMKKYNG